MNSEELKAAQARIACLEGEIAKRDAELASCRVSVENCDLFRARIAELEARIVWLECEAQVNAAPVSEVKAKGVRLPPRMWEDQDAESPEFARGHNAELGYVERLNAAPVQQVSVPDGWKLVPVEPTPEMLKVGTDARWKSCIRNANNVFEIYRAMLAAAPAAPAADGWISVSERLPDVPDGDEREVIVCVKRAHNGQSYSFSARYLNNFPLHSDSEDEPMIVTGWHDVKEHAEYDGWYSPLIDSSSGDEVTHWMPLPAAHRAKGVV